MVCVPSAFLLYLPLSVSKTLGSRYQSHFLAVERAAQRQGHLLRLHRYRGTQGLGSPCRHPVPPACLFCSYAPHPPAISVLHHEFYVELGDVLLMCFSAVEV